MKTETIPFPKRIILGVPLHAVTWAEVLAVMDQWLGGDSPRQVSVVNAHSMVMAGKDPEFMRSLWESDLVLPDSFPVARISRWIGRPLPERIGGPDFFEALCGLAEQSGRSIFFLGSTPATLELIQSRLRARFPRLKIAGVFSPPMKPEFSVEDSAAMIEAVNKVSPDILWVGLTAPKQEKWIRRHIGRLNCKVAVGIGAAFDFVAGTRRRAPQWVQAAGFEWFYRFVQEPRRLWRRYLVSNVVFFIELAKDLIRHQDEK